MKFERGRKKNQLIWSFILKDIASQRSVKVLFLIKSEKENASGRIRFRSRGDVLGTLRYHLTRGDGRASH